MSLKNKETQVVNYEMCNARKFKALVVKGYRKDDIEQAVAKLRTGILAMEDCDHLVDQIFGKAARNKKPSNAGKNRRPRKTGARK